MEGIHIGRFRAHFRLRPAEYRHRRRLHRVIDALVHDGTAGAFEGARLPAREFVCVRRLSVPVRLRLSDPEPVLAAHWGRRLREAIEAALAGVAPPRVAGGQPVEVVRFHSRAHALTDMAQGVALEDLGRAWAWRRLGLWQAGDVVTPAEAAIELVRALVREPTLLVATLETVAIRGGFDRLLARLEPDHWLALAKAALEVAGATLDWRELRPAPERPRAAWSDSPESRPAVEEWFGRAQRLVAGSSLAAACLGEALPSSVRRAVAALIVLEREPVLVRRPRTEVLGLVDAVSEAVGASPAPGPDTLRPAPAKPTASAEPLDQVAETDAIGDRFGVECVTEWGGLLFLLHVVEALGLPERWVAAFPNRSFAWGLHCLALELAPLEPDDPAALAFAGMRPGSSPPGAAGEPPTAAERALFVALADEIRTDLERRLAGLEVAEGGLCQWICRRRATLFFDPGWLEARFALDTVSTDLRRAGLDLDPGYVRWLGMVVRFVYE